jgi:hypothetical protein
MKTAKEKDPDRLRIRDLGFESVPRLAKSLRLHPNELDHLAHACQNAYPYTCWHEPKRSGNGNRLIEHPSEDLKRAQQAINRLLQRLDLPGIFHGCHAGTSIVSNAVPHRNVSWFLTFDLANYYKTIRPRKVYEGFVALSASPDAARVLTRLTTIKGRVPQGAPTSPLVAAIAMLSMARRLGQLAAKFGLNVSVYGDNVAVSGPKTVVRHKNTMLGIGRSEGFRVRAHKTLKRAPDEDKPLPGLIIRGGEITVYDEDYDRVSRMLDACLALGPDGLARKVCDRFVRKLSGTVNHYAWIDPIRMAGSRRKLAKIQWPPEYVRASCWSPKCHCTPLRVGGRA